MKPPRSATKFSEHKTFTTKLVNHSNPPLKTPKNVRISVTDGDATDSSSDNDDDHHMQSHCHRVKKHTHEIRIDHLSTLFSSSPPNQTTSKNNPQILSRSEMQHPIRTKGPDALADFSKSPRKADPPVIDMGIWAISGYSSAQEPESLSSPTSVLVSKSNAEAGRINSGTGSLDFAIVESDRSPIEDEDDVRVLAEAFRLTDPDFPDNPSSYRFWEETKAEDNWYVELEVDLGVCLWSEGN